MLAKIKNIIFSENDDQMIKNIFSENYTINVLSPSPTSQSLVFLYPPSDQKPIQE